MRILFIGRFFPKQMLKNLTSDSRGKAGLSNHNFEMSVINGLCQHKRIELDCLSIPGVYSYPHNNRKLFTKAESYDYKNTHIYSVSFCNLVFLKELWSTISLCILVTKLIIKSETERVDIIVNTPDNRLLNAISIARFFTRKRISQTVIIPDIPSIVTSMRKQNIFKSFLLRISKKDSIKNISKSDGLVLLTEAMLDIINYPIKHIIMEGLVDIEAMDVDVTESISPEKVILYTGTLRKIFGIMNLVNAFRMIPDEDAELWICGAGDAQMEVKDAAIQDPRIKFFGQVSPQFAFKMQRQATILVNPRTSEGEYTKYSFPSKTLEYLLSGKSVIINRLPGIPDEYYDYVYTPKNESIEALAECIKNLLAIEPQKRDKKALEGRQFVISKKNSKIQTHRILEMISNY